MPLCAGRGRSHGGVATTEHSRRRRRADLRGKRQQPDELQLGHLKRSGDGDSAADLAIAKRVEENNAQLCKRLSQMKAILYGSEDKVEIDEHKAEELSVCIQTVRTTCLSFLRSVSHVRARPQEGLLLILVHQLNSIPFEVHSRIVDFVYLVNLFY